jgi:hypothetical protein
LLNKVVEGNIISILAQAILSVKQNQIDLKSAHLVITEILVSLSACYDSEEKTANRSCVFSWECMEIVPELNNISLFDAYIEMSKLVFSNDLTSALKFFMFIGNLGYDG